MVEIGLCKVDWDSFVIAEDLKNLLSLGRARLSCRKAMASATSSTKSVTMMRFEYQDIEGLFIFSLFASHELLKPYEICLEVSGYITYA